MMRPISLVCMLLAFVSGLYLYRVKYRAQMLDREIHTTLKSADEARARAAMLRADYALLNDPVRLQELVELHLTLKTTQPGQFTTLADLERRLPPIGIAPPEPPPEPEIPAAVIRPEPRMNAPEPRVLEPRGPEPRIAEPRIAEPRIADPPRPPAFVAARPAPPPAPMAPPVAIPPPMAASAAVSTVATLPRPAPLPPSNAAPRGPTPLGLPPQAQTSSNVPASGLPSPSLPSPATQVSARSSAPANAMPNAMPGGAAPAPYRPPYAAAGTPAPYRPAFGPTPIAAPAPVAEASPGMTRSALGMARRPLTPPSMMAPGGGGNN